MKMRPLHVLFPLVLVLLGLLPYADAKAAYPLAEVKNNTEHTVNGVVAYAGCRSDSFSVQPGHTWRATSRGLCLITGIEGMFMVPITIDKKGKVSGGVHTVEPYSSSGTSYSKFQIENYRGRYSIYSEAEWARKSKAFTLAYPVAEVKNNT